MIILNGHRAKSVETTTFENYEKRDSQINLEFRV